MGLGLIMATADHQGQASWCRVCAKTSFDLQTMCGLGRGSRTIFLLLFLMPGVPFVHSFIHSFMTSAGRSWSIIPFSRSCMYEVRTTEYAVCALISSADAELVLRQLHAWSITNQLMVTATVFAYYRVVLRSNHFHPCISNHDLWIQKAGGPLDR